LEYTRRVNLALDFIRQNLEKKLTLAMVAEAASFSEFHFHRIFLDCVGETWCDFVWRLRVEKAVSCLKSQSISVQQVAMDCGFSSQSNLAKALKKRYQVSATDIRRYPERFPLTPSPEIDTLVSVKPVEELDKEIVIKSIPERRIAYLRNIGNGINPLVVNLLWMRLIRWASVKGLYNQGSQNIAIVLDDPNLTHPNQCQYDAAVTLPANFIVNGPVNERIIPAGVFATFEWQGKARELNSFVKTIFREWFPQSGYVPGGFPTLIIHRKKLFDTPRGILDVEVNVLLNTLSDSQ
jgi:AraC family transcriptional regulator